MTVGIWIGAAWMRMRTHSLTIELSLSLTLSHADLEETIASGIVDPWVVVGASDAGLQVDGLPGNLLGGQLAGIWHPAGLSALNHAPLPPGLEVLDLADGAWILHPLYHLCHGHKVHIIVIGQDLIDPVEECVQELGIVLQPGGMEVQTKRCTILIVMAIEIVIQEIVELIASQDI